MQSGRQPRRPGILFVCHYLRHVVGGAEIIGHRVVQFLREAGWPVETVTLPGPREVVSEASHEWRLPLGLEPGSLLAKQLAVYAGALGLDSRAASSVLPSLSGRSFGLVVAHDTVSAGAAAALARALGIPWACFVYEPLPRAIPQGAGPRAWIGGLLTRHANQALRSLLPSARVRIAASADTARRLEAFAPGAPTVVAYNSIQPPPSGLPQGEGFLFVGRLSAEKGFDLLAEAYRGLETPPPLALAALDGPLAPMAAELARDYPSVQILPRSRPEDMPAVYARHAIVVAPSAWPDPLPGAVLEARAMRRALLVSDRGGIPEIVEGYHPLRTVSMDAPRQQVVGALRRAMAEAQHWSGLPPDPLAEAAFHQRHSQAAHAAAVVRAIEGVPSPA